MTVQLFLACTVTGSFCNYRLICQQRLVGKVGTCVLIRYMAWFDNSGQMGMACRSSEKRKEAFSHFASAGNKTAAADLVFIDRF